MPFPSHSRTFSPQWRFFIDRSSARTTVLNFGLPQPSGWGWLTCRPRPPCLRIALSTSCGLTQQHMCAAVARLGRTWHNITSLLSKYVTIFWVSLIRWVVFSKEAHMSRKLIHCNPRLQKNRCEVWRNLFLLLLDFSAWSCLTRFAHIFFSRSLYMEDVPSWFLKWNTCMYIHSIVVFFHWYSFCVCL